MRDSDEDKEKKKKLKRKGWMAKLRDAMTNPNVKKLDAKGLNRYGVEKDD